MTAPNPHGGTLTDQIEAVSAEQQARLIKQFDHESNFRKLVGPVGMLVTTIAVVLSGFHIYTAGFGLLVEIKHRTFHLALVLGLIFLVFPRPTPAADARGIAKEWGWALAFGAFYLYLAWDLVDRLTSTGELQVRRRLPRARRVRRRAHAAREALRRLRRPRVADRLAAGAAGGRRVAVPARVLRRHLHRARRLADRAGLHDGRARDHHGDGGVAPHDGAAAAHHRHGVPAVRAARPLHAGRARAPRLQRRARRQPHLRRHRGHLRHRGRRRRDLRVPLRAVRRARADDRAWAACSWSSRRSPPAAFPAVPPRSASCRPGSSG